MKTFLWVLFGFFAVAIGFYPVMVFYMPEDQGLLASKSADLLASPVWRGAFYTHISLGGLALLTGASQFSTRLRLRLTWLHRSLGTTYVVACVGSGVAGLYLAFHATGGVLNSVGFGGLALAWLGTTIPAWWLIRQRRIQDHRRWMVRSYSLTFAAVTLRIYLPLLADVLGLGFPTAYAIVAWLCWVPNLVVAEWIISKMGPMSPHPRSDAGASPPAAVSR